MTREKAVNEYVIPALKNTWNEKVCAKVINALGQADVLDKIRADIEKIANDYDKFDDYRRVRGLWIALEIIDKYREREVQE